jgi:hypothetical protein
MGSGSDVAQRSLAVALLAGVLFGTGLTLSEMVEPRRVAGFLDFAGAWDLTLAFVMGGALAVTFPLFPRILRRARPLWGDRFHLPAARDVDVRLVAGAALFGVGWGLSGFCPGPALASLALGAPEAWLFVTAMAAGMVLQRLALERRG